METLKSKAVDWEARRSINSLYIGMKIENMITAESKLAKGLGKDDASSLLYSILIWNKLFQNSVWMARQV